jgi:hypothetical protein
VLGILILLLTTSAIHKDFVAGREAAVFRFFNTLALPDWTWPGVWLGPRPVTRDGCSPRRRRRPHH